MNHKHLFHIHSKQHLLCTSGNFMEFVAVKAKIWWNKKWYIFFWNTVYVHNVPQQSCWEQCS